ncbi:Uncharacterised protein [Mycobacteroides abscessus subsp. massiliense]|nr:Uncharacterised protein [Mycobacteroides abscessus subsp. massiliense]
MDYTYQQATNRFRYRIVHASFPVMLVRGLAPCVVVVENSHREHPRHTETDDLGGPEHRGRGRGNGYRCLGRVQLPERAGQAGSPGHPQDS